MRETRKTEYKRCLVNDNCTTNEQVIGGHLIPRNYLQRLPGENNMAVFTNHRFGRPPESLPMKEGIGEATVGYFTCETHDKLFYEVDQLLDLSCMPEGRILDLMCYRNILYNRWWMRLWAQASRRVKYQHGLERQYRIAERLLADDQQFLKSQLAIEPSIGLRNGDEQTYSHLVLTSQGKPTLAAAVFGVLEVQTDRAGNERTTGLGQWGITLIPGYSTNALVIHYPSATGTQTFDMALPSLAKGRSKVTGREVTRAVLSSCYDVVFSQDSWGMLTDYERSQINTAMTSRTLIDNWTIDVFKGSDWTVV